MNPDSNKECRMETFIKKSYSQGGEDLPGGRKKRKFNSNPRDRRGGFYKSFTKIYSSGGTLKQKSARVSGLEGERSLREQEGGPGGVPGANRRGGLYSGFGEQEKGHKLRGEKG